MLLTGTLPMSDLAADILAALNEPGVSPLAVLERFPPTRTEFGPVWDAYPELYSEAADRLIRAGHPAVALDLAQARSTVAEATTGDPVPEGPALRDKLVLAAVRGGNPDLAGRLLAPLLTAARDPITDMPTGLRVEVLCRNGRVLKDQSRHHPDRLPLAAAAYEEGAAVPGAADLPDRGVYPLINAATLWRIAGDTDRATRFAAEVVRRVEPLAPAAKAAGDYWTMASLAEAYVLTGRHEDATNWYLAAVAAARGRGNTGDIVSIRSNLLRLRDAGATEDPVWIADHIGNVLVFAGHMVDAPGRAVPRFPNDPAMIAAVDAAIRAGLDGLNATVGFSSLASGADILFAEAMLARNAEVHVVLPFDRAEFLTESVHFGRPDDPAYGTWAERFECVWAAIPAAHRHFATTEPYLKANTLFELVNMFMQGLAVLRAGERLVDPIALVVLDPGSSPGVGGTKHFLDTWRSTDRRAEVIDLAALRTGVSKPDTGRTVSAGPLPPSHRPNKALLFADVAKYSGIYERDLPDFLAEYAGFLRRVFDTDVGRAADYANTWGDGLHLVYNDPADAAEFALTLLEAAGRGGVDWARYGLGDAAPVRVAVHYGPVFAVPDVLRPGKVSYSGQHVNRAARIEPVTLAGCALRQRAVRGRPGHVRGRQVPVRPDRRVQAGQGVRHVCPVPPPPGVTADHNWEDTHAPPPVDVDRIAQNAGRPGSP